MKIACVHTSAKDVSMYQSLFDARGEDVQLDHLVEPDLLVRGQAGDIGEVRADLDAAMAYFAKADVVLCTCTTLAPLVGENPRYLSVTEAAFGRACQMGPDVLVAARRESALAASVTALHRVCERDGLRVQPRPVLCDGPAGEGQIALAIGAAIDTGGIPDCILLAQASMRTAASELSRHGVPVLATPDTAVEAALKMARS